MWGKFKELGLRQKAEMVALSVGLLLVCGSFLCHDLGGGSREAGSWSALLFHTGAMLFMAAFSSESFSTGNRGWGIFLAALAVLGAVELPMFVLFVLP